MASPAVSPAAPAPRLRDLSPQQWRTGLAAWLGWMFDGLELHLYTLIATPLVVQLLAAPSAADPAVKEKAAYIQAAFLIGWALGGAFFGRLGDVLGRSRALALTILTYALCTGLCAFAQTWWQLMLFRFIAALGIGGEWAVGASLLAETWPKTWRPWIAAVLQTGVNVGILLAAATVHGLALLPVALNERYIFLVGVLPAVVVFWIRKNVPEPEGWQKADQTTTRPRVSDLFRGELARTTLLTTAVSALSLSAWWLFVFWHPQHLRQLLGAAGLPAGEITAQVTAAFFTMICVSIVGNFAAGALARRLGNRWAITVMILGLTLGIVGGYAVPRDFAALAWFWIPLIGFFSGVFGLFTMYLPPLFPTLLRTTGAGFCYNIGRIAAAVASLVFGWFAPVGDFRVALLSAASLGALAVVVGCFLPERTRED